MPEVKISRYVDYQDGSLLVLTADLHVGQAWALRAGREFAWWMASDDEIVGFSYDGLERGGSRSEGFLKSLDYRVSVPQLRLTAASIYEVVRAARRFFILEGHDSPAAEAYGRAKRAAEGSDRYEALQEWLCLYHVHGDVEGLFGMGNTLLELGDPAGAIKALGKFLSLRPDDAWAQRYLGCAYFSMSENSAARRHWQAAVECEEQSGTGDTGAAVLLEGLSTACASDCVGNCPGTGTGSNA